MGSTAFPDSTFVPGKQARIPVKPTDALGLLPTVEGRRLRDRPTACATAAKPEKSLLSLYPRFSDRGVPTGSGCCHSHRLSGPACTPRLPLEPYRFPHIPVQAEYEDAECADRFAHYSHQLTPQCP